MSKIEAIKCPALHCAGDHGPCHMSGKHSNIVPTPKFPAFYLMFEHSSNMNSIIVKDETADISTQSMEEVSAHTTTDFQLGCVLHLYHRRINIMLTSEAFRENQVIS